MVTNEIRTEHLFVVSLVLLIPLLLVLWFQRRRTETYVLGVALLWLGITWLLAVWFLPIFLYDMGDSGGRPYLRSLHPFRYLLLYIDEYRSLDAATEPLAKESYWFEIREIPHNAISAS
ncbi:MAG: hypothetical protein QM296_13965, partial [Bacillota bacterium]|nr:hypothetical protein [Bacillota bacterium]